MCVTIIYIKIYYITLPEALLSLISLSLYEAISEYLADRFDVASDRYRMPTKEQYWQRQGGVRGTNKERNYPLLFSNHTPEPEKKPQRFLCPLL